MLYRPNSSARVTAPTPGRANSRMPKATDTRPETMNSARVPAVSPLPNPAATSTTPPTRAQAATTMTRTYAVGPGQTSARIVTLGQAMAMIPTMTARMPSTINEVDVDLSDLNMTGVRSFRTDQEHQAL